MIYERNEIFSLNDFSIGRVLIMIALQSKIFDEIKYMSQITRSYGM
jgi:hypothetical protein